MRVYWPRVTASFPTRLVSRLSSQAKAPGPETVTSPMWEISNIPEAERTARCSSIMPEYWTGMNQPPNSTMRAPQAT